MAIGLLKKNNAGSDSKILYLIKKGKLNNRVLTGGTSNAYLAGGSVGGNYRPLVANTSGDYKVYIPYNGSARQTGGYNFTPTIDVTKYKKLHIEYELSLYVNADYPYYETGAMILVSSLSSSNPTYIFSYQSRVVSETKDVDISNLSGYQYIDIVLTTNETNVSNYVKIKNLWLEK